MKIIFAITSPSAQNPLMGIWPAARILNEADDAPEYLSYSIGERHRPPDLAGAQGEVLEKILGRRVDSSELSRIAADVALEAPLAGEMGEKLGGLPHHPGAGPWGDGGCLRGGAGIPGP